MFVHKSKLKNFLHGFLGFTLSHAFVSSECTYMFGIDLFLQ